MTIRSNRASIFRQILTGQKNQGVSDRRSMQHAVREMANVDNWRENMKARKKPLERVGVDTRIILKWV